MFDVFPRISCTCLSVHVHVDFVQRSAARNNDKRCRMLTPAYNTTRKTNFASFNYSHGSTDPADLVKIGPADVETIGMTESSNKKK